ncbi:MAG: D-alanine--D-alanine ligase [Proteobacteria bacterium]|nr:D-alanine--D-alanine ligase [Pseudomonadota bacterium]
MRIGIIYNPKPKTDNKEIYEKYCEFDTEDTIDAIGKIVRKRGFGYEKIKFGKEALNRLTSGDIDFVFNIAEGIYGRSRESQIPTICEMFRIPYLFSDPITLGITLDKPLAKKIVSYDGILTPEYHVIDSAIKIPKDVSFPQFVKPSMEGSSKGIHYDSIINDREVLREVVKKMLSKYKQPVLMEKYLSGREFTVGIIGNREPQIFGILEISYKKGIKNIYSIENKSDYIKRVSYSLFDEMKGNVLYNKISQISLNAYKSLQCRDAARVDIRCDEEEVPYFLEINPLPGLNPVYSDFPIMARFKGVEYDDFIGSILSQGFKRYGL